MAQARPPRRGRRFCRFSFTSGAQSSVLPADLGGSRRREMKEKRKIWGLGMLGGVSRGFMGIWEPARGQRFQAGSPFTPELLSLQTPRWDFN